LRYFIYNCLKGLRKQLRKQSGWLFDCNALGRESKEEREKDKN
jgi:hypothetical protein